MHKQVKVVSITIENINKVHVLFGSCCPTENSQTSGLPSITWYLQAFIPSKSAPSFSILTLTPKLSRVLKWLCIRATRGQTTGRLVFNQLHQLGQRIKYIRLPTPSGQSHEASVFVINRFNCLKLFVIWNKLQI